MGAGNIGMVRLYIHLLPLRLLIPVKAENWRSTRNRDNLSCRLQGFVSCYEDNLTFRSE